MKIEFTQEEKDILLPLLEERYELEKSDEDILNDNYFNNLHCSIQLLKNKLIQSKPFSLTKYDKTNIQSCINPEIGKLSEDQFILKKNKDAIEWLNIKPSKKEITRKIDLLEFILTKIEKKYKPAKYFEIFDLIDSLKKCEKLILSKYNDTYIYKVRFVKKNNYIFQIELSNALELEYKRFTKSSKTLNSIDLRNRNVDLFSREEALKEIQNSEFVPQVQNRKTVDFIIKVLSDWCH